MEIKGNSRVAHHSAKRRKVSLSCQFNQPSLPPQNVEPVVRAARFRRSGRGSHWKATPISTESPTRMSMATQAACDAAVIAVRRLWER
jgi:hypothetical protein